MVRWSVGDTRDAQQLDADTRLRRESVRHSMPDVALSVLDAGCVGAEIGVRKVS